MFLRNSLKSPDKLPKNHLKKSPKVIFFLILQDERIALMLQNEEFMAELRRDTEFMTALEMEQERAASFAESSRQTGSSGLKTGKGATGKKMHSVENTEIYSH